MQKIIVDTETTGLHPEIDDDLLQVSIIDDQGLTLFDSLIRPHLLTSWDDAMAINHITPEMVQDAPEIVDVRRQIQDIFDHADMIIGYNTPFDLEFLRCCGNIRPLIDTQIIDVMQDFMHYMVHDRWFKLTAAADYFDFDWKAAPAHNSLGDCLATLHVYKNLQERGFYNARKSASRTV